MVENYEQQKNRTLISSNLQKKVIFYVDWVYPARNISTMYNSDNLVVPGGSQLLAPSCHLHQSGVSISYSLLICSCSCGAVISSLIFNSIWSIIVHGKASFEFQIFVMHFSLGSCHFQFQLLIQLLTPLHIIQGWSLFSSPFLEDFPQDVAL